MNELLHPTLAFFDPISLGALLHIFLCIVATIKTVRYTQGVAVPVWLAFVWLVPYIGAICAILFIRKVPSAGS